MKILYLLEPQQDYGEFYMYGGLCELLGEDNEVMYPSKLSYLGIGDKYYTLDDGKRGCTHPASYVKIRNPKILTLEEIIENIKSFDFMVLSSPRTYPVRALRFIRKYFGGNPIPLIYTDHEDGDNIRYDLIKEFEPDVIFKRELINPIENIYPLPFSSCVPYLPIYKELLNLEKKYDVFGLFGNTNQLRVKAVESLLPKYYKNSCIGIDTGVVPWQDDTRFEIPPLKGYNEYLEIMALSKINLVIKGHGFDTVRRFEAMTFDGLVISDKLPLLTPYLPIDGKHIVYFNDIKDLEDKIDYYLKNDEKRIEIAKAGQEYAQKYHTNLARANYLLDIVSKSLSGEKVNLDKYEIGVA